jgi:hypothetical protein
MVLANENGRQVSKRIEEKKRNVLFDVDLAVGGS